MRKLLGFHPALIGCAVVGSGLMLAGCSSQNVAASAPPPPPVAAPAPPATPPAPSAVDDLQAAKQALAANDRQGAIAALDRAKPEIQGMSLSTPDRLAATQHLNGARRAVSTGRLTIANREIDRTVAALTGQSRQGHAPLAGP
jgi:hypothetical protein